MSSKKKAVAKTETFSNEQNQATVKKVGQWTPQSVTQKVTDASVAINRTLADVTAQLQGQLKEYEEANQAVELKKAELETIFSKEQVLKSIDELNADHENQKLTLEQEFSLYQQELAAKQQTLELERNKENEQFQYNLQQQRREDQLKFEENNRVLAAQERDRKEAIEKNFLLREEELKKRETEIIELRKQVAEFPTRIAAEVKERVDAAVGAVRRDEAHKFQLLQKDFETSKVVSENTIKGYQERLIANDKVIGELTLQLTNAQNKVSEIAKEALQSASNTKSLADVKDFMQNQGNGQTARKA